jgi:hypothetical protein
MEISSERIDDIPLVAALLNQMEVAKWIDQQLKQPHGNHQGLKLRSIERIAVDIHH